MAATEPIRNKNQLRALGEYFLKRGQLRNYALIVVGMHTALRISDLLRLKWADVYDGERGEYRAHVTIERSAVVFPAQAGRVHLRQQSERAESDQPGSGMAHHPCGGGCCRDYRKNRLSQPPQDLGLSCLDEQGGVAGGDYGHLQSQQLRGHPPLPRRGTGRFGQGVFGG